MSLSDFLRRVEPAEQDAPALAADVVKAPATEDDRVSVIIPSFDDHQEFECLWMLRGLSFPQVGDRALVIFGDDGEPWVTAWYSIAGGPTDAIPLHGSTHETTGSDPIPSLPTSAQKSALQGTSGAPGSGNRYVTNADARNSDNRVPTDGSVTNAKVAAGAAIAKSKLAALAIVDADVAAGAAIAKSKLAALSIVNADVAAGAAIAKSKLAALAIVNADVDAAAAIAESKLNLASDAAAGTASRRTLGSGATQAAPGNHTHAELGAGQQAVSGDVKWSATKTADHTGWILADGRAITAAMGFTTLRADLIAAGNPYGVSGADPRIPDLRGRAVIGAGTGAIPSALTARALGATPGAESHTLVAGETPVPAHDHNMVGANAGGSPPGTISSGGRTMIRGAGAGGGSNRSLTIPTDTGSFDWGIGVGSVTNASAPGAHNNMQPSMALHPFIKT